MATDTEGINPKAKLQTGRGKRENTRPPNSQGGLPGEGVPGPLPDKFVKQLEEAGLGLSRDGTRITAKGAGPTRFTKQQLALMQEAYNRFGIEDNGAFDPRRVAFSGKLNETQSGEKQGVFVDLATGVHTSGGGNATDEELEFLRAQVGFDEAAAYELALERETENGYVPAYLKTFENFANYNKRARANYLASAQEQQPAATTVGGGPSFLGGFDVEGMNEFGLGDVVSQFLEARQNREAAQSAYGDVFGIEELGGGEE